MSVRFLKTREGAPGFAVHARGNVTVEGHAWRYVVAPHFVLASERLPHTDKGPPFQGAADRATVSAMLNANVDDAVFETTGELLRAVCETTARHFEGYDGEQPIAFVDETYVVDARAVMLFAAYLGAKDRVIVRRIEHESERCLRFDAPRSRMFLARLTTEPELVIGMPGEVSESEGEIGVDLLRAGNDRAYALQFVRTVRHASLAGSDPAAQAAPPAASFKRGAEVVGENQDGGNAAMVLREASRACEVHGFSWGEIDRITPAERPS